MIVREKKEALARDVLRLAEGSIQRKLPAFGAALRRAREAGVEVRALDCRVGPDFLEAGKWVEVRL